MRAAAAETEEHGDKRGRGGRREQEGTGQRVQLAKNSERRGDVVEIDNSTPSVRERDAHATDYAHKKPFKHVAPLPLPFPLPLSPLLSSLPRVEVSVNVPSRRGPELWC